MQRVGLSVAFVTVVSVVVTPCARAEEGVPTFASDVA